MRPIMLLAAILCVLVAHPARALERIIIGTVGAPSGGQWPYLIGMKKGFFAAAGLELDIIYVPSAPGLIQQLVAGSLEAVATSGLVEPILASEKGAPSPSSASSARCRPTPSSPGLGSPRSR